MDSDQPVMPQSTPSDSIEQLSSGLTREWVCGRQIVIYTLTDVRRETADTWAAAFKSDILAWSSTQPFRVIHDFSSSQVISTPYGRKRAQEMVDTRPDIRVRAAFVLSGSALSQLIHIFLNHQNHSALRLRRTFRTRKEAIKWLLG